MRRIVVQILKKVVYLLEELIKRIDKPNNTYMRVPKKRHYIKLK